MSNDSSDSDDESQEPKGKRIFSGRGPLGKELRVLSDSSLKMLMVVSA